MKPGQYNPALDPDAAHTFLTLPFQSVNGTLVHSPIMVNLAHQVGGMLGTTKPAPTQVGDQAMRANAVEDQFRGLTGKANESVARATEGARMAGSRVLAQLRQAVMQMRA